MSNLRIEKSILFLFLIIIVVAVTIVIITFSLKTNLMQEMIEKDQLINTLILIEGKNKEILTSNVLLYYPVTHRSAMFNIPGNTGAIYNSLGRVDRIDAVYKEKGLDSYKAEVEKMLGVAIPFILIIDREQLSLLTDYLGGLRLFISSPVETSVTDPETQEIIHYLLPSGSVSLDGEKILTYLDFSLPEDLDSDVFERRQSVLRALLIALNSQTNQLFTQENFKFYESCFTSNIDRDSLILLLSEISTIDAEGLSIQSITGKTREVDGKKLLFPLYEGQFIKDVCKQSMSSLVSTEDVVYTRTYVLEIQNGTTVQGLARNTAILLQNAGYDVLSMVNADANDYETTMIIDHIGNDVVARSLGEFIHCEQIVTEEINADESDYEASSYVDFTIILGSDFDGRYVR